MQSQQMEIFYIFYEFFRPTRLSAWKHLKIKNKNKKLGEEKSRKTLTHVQALFTKHVSSAGIPAEKY